MDCGTFLFKRSWADIFNDFTDEQAGALTKAIFRYVERDGEKAIFLSDQAVKTAFKFISKEIDAFLPSAADSLHPIKGEDEERMELLEILFFDRRIRNAVSEFERFWNHYKARGWCDGKGQPIRNKAAMLYNWTVQDSRMFPEKFMIGYRKVYNKAKDITGVGSLLMITGFHGYEARGEALLMIVSESLHDFMEDNIYALRGYFKTELGVSRLSYRLNL